MPEGRYKEIDDSYYRDVFEREYEKLSAAGADQKIKKELDETGKRIDLDPNAGPLYNSEGQVLDPEKAAEAASIEDGYRGKIFGIFKPSKKRMLKGEQAAEAFLEKHKEISFDAMPAEIKEYFFKSCDPKIYWHSETVEQFNLGDKIGFRIKIKNKTYGYKGLATLILNAEGEIKMVYQRI